MPVATDQPCLDLLASVLDREPIGVALARAEDLHIVYANPAFQSLLPHVPIEGRAFGEVWPGHEAVVPRLERVAETGEPWSARDRRAEIELPDGTRQVAYYAFDVSRVAIGGVPYLLGFVTETTAEVRARETGELLASVMDNMSDSLFVFDGDLRFTYLNDRALANIGLSASEVIGRTAPEVFGDRGAPVFEQAFSRALAEREAVSFQAPSPIRDAWIDVRIYPLPNGGVAAFYSDITERRRIEEELLFRATLLDNVTDGVFVYSAEEEDLGAFIYLNRAAHEQRGYTREELMAMGLGDLIADTFRSRLPEWIASLREAGQAGFESAHRRKDGSIMPVEVNARLMRYRGRSVALSVVRDISERKAADERVSRELSTSRQLLDAAESLAHVTDLRALLEGQALAVLRATDHRRVTVSLWDEQQRSLVIAASQGERALPLGGAYPIETSSSPLREAFARRRTRVIDYDALAEGERGFVAGPHDIRVALFVPIVFRGSDVGAIWVDDPGEHAEFSEREIEIVEAIAAQAAAGIENARLFEERTSQAAYAEALNRIDAAVHSTLETSVIMDRVVVETAGALGVDAVAVHMREEGRWEFRYSHGLPEELRRRQLTDDEAPLSMSVLHSRQPLVSDDVRRDERANVRLMQRFDISSLVAVPLVVRDEVIGVLFAGRIGRTARLSPEQTDFTLKVAATLALALENARLYETERGIANKLQEALLALPDRLEGVTFAHAYRSASEATRVGGDFYDVFAMPGDRVGVTIGDVAGKGLDAAVMTSLVKNTVRAHSSTVDTRPRNVLALTNDVVYHATPSEWFVTVFFGVLDRLTGRLDYTNAGHPTAALVTPDGIHSLPATGPLLGAFPDIEFGESPACCVSRTDQLFLYTDGVIEARRHRRQYGEKRLFRVLEAAAGLGPPQIVTAVVDDVLAFATGGLHDDLAILALALSESE